MKEKTIAVLPFVNMSSNIENEYFSDGITEEIINALAKIDEIKVTSRTSSFYFKGKNIPITEIGKQLNVSTILEIGIVYATKGDFPKATAYLLKTKNEAQNFHVASEENAVVIINIYLGNLDLAFEEIKKDIKANKYYLNFYKENPAFKLLLNDPRYKIFDTVFKTKGTMNQKNQAIKAKRLSRGSEERMKKKKALIAESKVEACRNRLLQYMTEEMPYLNANLSLRTLADLINMHPNQLSWLLNEGLGKNFSEFINHYRVETFKSLAKDPANANITVLGLAYDSGFNSKTVFNTYFKKETGMTPREFLKG